MAELLSKLNAFILAEQETRQRFSIQTDREGRFLSTELTDDLLVEFIIESQIQNRKKVNELLEVSKVEVRRERGGHYKLWLVSAECLMPQKKYDAKTNPIREGTGSYIPQAVIDTYDFEYWETYVSSRNPAGTAPHIQSQDSGTIALYGDEGKVTASPLTTYVSWESDSPSLETSSDCSYQCSCSCSSCSYSSSLSASCSSTAPSYSSAEWGMFEVIDELDCMSPKINEELEDVSVISSLTEGSSPEAIYCEGIKNYKTPEQVRSYVQLYKKNWYWSECHDPVLHWKNGNGFYAYRAHNCPGQMPLNEENRGDSENLRQCRHCYTLTTNWSRNVERWEKKEPSPKDLEIEKLIAAMNKTNEVRWTNGNETPKSRSFFRQLANSVQKLIPLDLPSMRLRQRG